MIIREAKRQGVKHIVVTHAMLAPIRMTMAQMQEAAGLGAKLEFVYHAVLEPPDKVVTMDQMAAAIRKVGPEHCILSSDLGQAGAPLHPDGLVTFFRERVPGFEHARIAATATQIGVRESRRLAGVSSNASRAAANRSTRASTCTA